MASIVNDVLDIAVLATDPPFTEQYVTAHSLLQKHMGSQCILYRDVTMTSQLTVSQECIVF